MHTQARKAATFRALHARPAALPPHGDRGQPSGKQQCEADGRRRPQWPGWAEIWAKLIQRNDIPPTNRDPHRNSAIGYAGLDVPRAFENS